MIISHGITERFMLHVLNHFLFESECSLTTEKFSFTCNIHGSVLDQFQFLQYDSTAQLCLYKLLSNNKWSSYFSNSRGKKCKFECPDYILIRINIEFRYSQVSVENDLSLIF